MTKISKFVVIGSGPIIIGQAAVAGGLADVGQPTWQLQPTRQIQPTRQVQPTQQIRPTHRILGQTNWKLGIEG